MLRVARRYSESAADADDAYQRALEKLLTRPPELTESADPLPWLITVVRNEALMIVRSRGNMRAVPLESVDDLCIALDVNPADRVVGREEERVGIVRVTQGFGQRQAPRGVAQALAGRDALRDLVEAVRDIGRKLAPRRVQGAYR